MNARRFPRTVTVLAVVLLLLGLAALERLNLALSAMHRAGDVSAGYDSVASSAALWSGPTIQEYVRAWQDWDVDRISAGLKGHYISPYLAVLAAAVLHFLFVAVPVAGLLWLGVRRAIARVRRRKEYPQPDGLEPDRRTALAAIVTVARWAALIYLVLTLVADALVVAVVWGGAPGILVLAIGLAALAALIALAAAILALAFVGLATLPLAGPGHLGRLFSAGFRHLVAVRAQLVAALLITAIIVALQGELGLQLDDVVMRWIEDPWAAVFALAAAGFAGWVLLISGGISWNRYQRARPGIDPISRLDLYRIIVAGLVLCTGWLLVAKVWEQGWGDLLAFPGIALVVFGLLSLPQRVRQVSLTELPATGLATSAPAPAGLAPAGPAPAEPGPAPAEPASIGPAPAEPASTGPVETARLLVSLLATVPLVALGLIVARATTTLAVSQVAQAWWLGVVAVGALAAPVLIGYFPLPLARDRFRWAGVALLIGVAVTVVIAVVVGAWPIEVGPRIGAIALLFLLAAAVAVVLTGLALLGEVWTPAGALALLKMRRVPAVTFFAAWFVVASLIGDPYRYHDVRLADPLPPAAAPVLVSQAVTTWVKQHSGEPGVRHQVPMVFISAAGGGIRAAYWTAMVLDCLFAAHPVQKECAGGPLDQSAVFAESGISGGSVGLVFDRVLAGTGRTYANVLDQDFVSPDAAALTFRDALLGWLRLEQSGFDRAAVLEQAWERAAGSPSPLRRGLFADARDAQGQLRFPLLMLNGATVDDGCRLNGSVLTAAVTAPHGPVQPAGTDDCLSMSSIEPGRADPAGDASSTLAATKDLYDYLCTPGSLTRHDIALSSAALLSARFPYISPTGALTSCSDPQRRTYDIDGGLVEGSGLSPLTELWAHIAGQVQAINDDPAGTVCIQPRLLMIDNGYLPAAPGTAPSQPQELLAPIEGQSRVLSLRSAQAEQAASLAFDHAFAGTTCPGFADAPRPVSRVAHFVPTARPGPQAPLGWSLSRFARDDLEEQLNSTTNRCEIELVRSWFGTGPNEASGYCLTGFAVRTDAAATGHPALSRFIGPLDGWHGVAGVRLTVAGGCEKNEPRTSCEVTTDAAGRYALLVKLGKATGLTVSWPEAKPPPEPLSLPLPDHPGFVDTSINVLVTR